eukprot:224813_1
MIEEIVVVILLIVYNCFGQTPLKLLSNIIIEKNAGEYSQIKIGYDELPFMVYQSKNYGCPAIAHCNDILCKNITHNYIDVTGNPENARFNFMKMMPRSASVPQISYSEQGNISSSFKFVTCNDALCDSYNLVHLYNTTTENNLNNKPGYSAFTHYIMDIYAIPLIVYQINGIGLKYIYCNDEPCTDYSPAVSIATGKNNGHYPGIGIFEKYLYVIIVYYNGDEQNIEYKICDNISCNNKITKGIIDNGYGNYGKYQYMQIISDDSLSVIYVNETNGDLKYATCTMMVTTMLLKCDISIVDNIGIDAYGVFPELDEYYNLNQYPVMSYFNSISNISGSINFAQCNNMKCDNAVTQTLASGLSGYGRDSSIAYSNSTVYVSFLNYNGGGQKISQLLVLHANRS